MATPAPKQPPGQPGEPGDQAQSDEIQRLQGRGTIYRNGQRLGDTGYDIMIVPPKHRRVVSESGTPPLDRPDISGILTDAFYLLGEGAQDTLTLVLENGRRFEFRVLVPDTNEIIGISDLHD